jgi:S-adenosylmethionine decarboxylase proenzyme
MFSNNHFSGKHLIMDIKEINNISLLNDRDGLNAVLTGICQRHNYNILNTIEHLFDPVGISIIFLLYESHITIHTFPEKRYIAFDLYTCHEYENNDVYNKIYDDLIESFDAKRDTSPIIINRGWN